MYSHDIRCLHSLKQFVNDSSVSVVMAECVSSFTKLIEPIVAAFKFKNNIKLHKHISMSCIFVVSIIVHLKIISCRIILNTSLLSQKNPLFGYLFHSHPPSYSLPIRRLLSTENRTLQCTMNMYLVFNTCLKCIANVNKTIL